MSENKINEMDKELLHILRHSLGLDRHGRGESYRNHFVAGDADVQKCRDLVSLGCMREHPSSALTGGGPLFTVTENGMIKARAKEKL